VNTTESDSARVHELERRIEELESADEAAFGHFTTWDWALCIVFSVAMPLLLVWWFAP